MRAVCVTPIKALINGMKVLRMAFPTLSAIRN